MLVRPAVAADAAQIGALHVRCWQAAYAGLVPRSLLAGVDPAARLTRWKEILRETDWPRNGTLVAVDGHRLVGFSRICPAGEVDGERTGQVAAFHVSPERWREGIGRALMDVALARLAGARFDNAILWVVRGKPGPFPGARHFGKSARVSLKRAGLGARCCGDPPLIGQ